MEVRNLRKLIEESGLKHTFLAGQLGITKEYLSMLLAGRYAMKEEYEKEIRRLCMKIIA